MAFTKRKPNHMKKDPLLESFCKRLKGCPICGQKSFLKIKTTLTVWNPQGVHTTVFGDIHRPAWARGPHYSISCSFNGCLISGHEFTSLENVLIWWNALPRKADYGLTWEKKHEQKTFDKGLIKKKIFV